ncbi:MAG: hypothetical protein EXQ98_07790 [Alphaproteobacteria bacterium]|nr:hypothetical protein [Alphaproteobacteria bacterium]
MDITPTIPSDRQYVQRYDAFGFRVTGVELSGSVIVLPDRTVSWPINQLDEVDLASLQVAIEAVPKPEILILGCGRRGAPPDMSLRAALKAHGIALEMMDTGAACRTYNVLLGERRLAAAALIKLGA